MQYGLQIQSRAVQTTLFPVPPANDDEGNYFGAQIHTIMSSLTPYDLALAIQQLQAEFKNLDDLLIF